MLRVISARAALAIGSLLLFACEPSPDTIYLRSRPDMRSTTQATPERSIVEGDLLVIDATPRRSGEEMDLCVAPASSDPSVVEVRPVRGECRVFVLLAKGAGRARVSFTARSVTSLAELDVLPSR